MTIQAVVEDLTSDPHQGFRHVLDAVQEISTWDGAPGQTEIVVRCTGQEALKVRFGGPGVNGEEPLRAICGSAFKPFLAVCLRKVLRDHDCCPDTPLSTFGPGFRDSTTTANHLVDHGAGLPHIRAVAPSPDALSNHSRVTAGLRSLEPLWPAGRRTGYHAVSYGHLIQAVVEDLTGDTFADSLSRCVLAPAGIATSEISCTADRATHRSPQPLEVYGDSPIRWRPDGRAAIYKAMYPLRDLVDHLNRSVDSPQPVLSCGVATTASALASFYEFVSGDFGPPAFGDIVFDQVMRQPVQWQDGFLRSAGVPALKDTDGFGVPGFGGSVGFALPQAGVAVGIVTSALDASQVVSRRTDRLCKAVADAVVG